MARPEKETVVEEISKKLQDAHSVVLTDFRGLDVRQMQELRSKLLESDVEYKVVKNTLLKIAAQKCKLEGLENYLAGPTALAFGLVDPIAPAKVLWDFSKKHEFLKIKAGILNGKILDASKVKELATLPSREVLLAKLLSVIQAPLVGMVSCLNAPVQGFVNCLKAITQKKESELNA